MQWTHPSYPYLVTGKNIHQCMTSHWDLMEEHILVECGESAEARQRYCDAENITQLLHDVISKDIVDFRTR